MSEQESSSKQRAFLKRMGLVPLPTKRDTHFLIQLVTDGSPGASGRVPAQRAKYFKDESSRWQQKAVRRLTCDDAGTVQYLVPEDPVERAKDKARGVALHHPLRAYVAWHNGRKEMVYLDELTLY